MKNVAQMENDMERWLTDRERISKQLDSVCKRKDAIEKNAAGSQVIFIIIGQELCSELISAKVLLTST